MNSPKDLISQRRQSEAILELKLQRLVNLEYIKLKKELDDLTQQVQYLNFILTDEKRVSCASD